MNFGTFLFLVNMMEMCQILQKEGKRVEWWDVRYDRKVLAVEGTIL